MSQEHFVRRHSKEWSAFEESLERVALPLRIRRAKVLQGTQDTDFPQQYRRICQQLSLARRRRYSKDIIDRLNRMALRGHTLLYRRPPGSIQRFAQYILWEVPRAVRREWRLVSMAHFLFYGAALALFLASRPIRIWPTP